MPTTLFESFCKHVDTTIFSHENMGGVVAFVINKTFIRKFCEQSGITESSLMDSVRNSLWSPKVYQNHLYVKGILAIQLYAASIRANSDGLSSSNYRERLVQILDWNLEDLDRWMRFYQDRAWKSLYEWCNRSGFIIAKTYPRSGSGRYTQYPIQQAERVFTEEELINLACSFNDAKLAPGEDISEKSFWNIINKYQLSRYVTSSHAKNILASHDYASDGYTQVYNYYLRWDGTYKSIFDLTKKHISVNPNSLYLDGQFSNLELRDANHNLVFKLDLNNFSRSSLDNYYSFKRENFILFKKNDVYDNYWEETRYLEKGTDGIAIRIKCWPNHSYVLGSPFYSNKNIEIYRVTEHNGKQELFTEEKFYCLEGGLKVSKSQYILGATPLLRVNRKTKFWIDGELNESTSLDSIFILDLDEGSHCIKFPNCPKIEFSIVSPAIKEHIWSNEYNKWDINNSSNSWTSNNNIENGISGLDFSCFNTFIAKDDNAISSWTKFHVFGKSSNCNNIVLKILSHSNK